MAEAKREGRQTPSIHYKQQVEANQVQTLALHSNGSVTEVCGNLKKPYPEYLLSDSVDIIEPYGTILNLVVASDKAANYKIFSKNILQESSGLGYTHTMPVFSYHELLCIKPVSMNETVAQFHYDVYGGSARNFVNMSDVEGRVIDIVENEMTVFFEKENVSTLYPREWQNTKKQLPILLRVKNENGNLANLFSSMMQHSLPSDEMMWASPFMKLLAAAVYDSRDGNMYDELKIHIGQSGRSLF